MQCPFLSAHEHLFLLWTSNSEMQNCTRKLLAQHSSLLHQSTLLRPSASHTGNVLCLLSFEHRACKGLFSVLNSMWQVKGYCLDSASMGLTRSQKAWRMPQQCCFRRHLRKGQVCAPAHRHFWWDVPLDCPKRHGNLISSSPPNPIP